MALSAEALTTLAAALAHVGQDDDGGAIRGVVERCVDAASSTIKSFLGRPITYAGAQVDRLRGLGGVRLYVTRPPIVTVASIVVDGVPLTADDYVIENAEVGQLFAEGGWPWTASLQVGPSQHLAPGTEAPAIVVTYAGGFVTPLQATSLSMTRTLPGDLEMACLELASSLFRRRGRDLRVSSEGFNNSSYAFGGVMLPAEIRGVLEQYRWVANA